MSRLLYSPLSGTVSRKGRPDTLNAAAIITARHFTLRPYFAASSSMRSLAR
jgi:hypothetical protein